MMKGALRSRMWALATACVLVVSACGSTVDQASRERVSGGEALGRETLDPVDGSALDEEMPDLAGPARGTDGSTTAGAAGSATGEDVPRTPTSAAPVGPASEGGGGGVLPAGRGVRGVTDTVIRLGITSGDSSEAGAVAGALGGTGSGAYDPTYDEANAAALEAVNQAGGIAGRKVEPVVYRTNLANITTASGRQQELQRACSHWTEDNQVFAINSADAECAAKTKTPAVRTVGTTGPYTSQRRFESMKSYYYIPGGFLTDRRERALARFLLENGFFGKGAKVGLMIEGLPDHREGVERGMKPVLKAAGLEPEVEIVYPDPIQSPWSNYVLQMQMAGVTHIVFSAVSFATLPALFMMRAAQEQRYRPSWGIGTDITPAGLVFFDAPQDQLVNTRGMGWMPHWDIRDTSTQSETGRICAAALKRRGVDDSQDGWGAEKCEFFFFLKAAFEHADELSPAGLAAGVARLADGYPAVRTIGGRTRFGLGRHDGASMARLVVYERGAPEFRYVGAPQPVGD